VVGTVVVFGGYSAVQAAQTLEPRAPKPETAPPGAATPPTIIEKPKPIGGKTYCYCHCTTTVDGMQVGRQLTWEKKAHCNLNGTKCKLEKENLIGTLSACGECTTEASGVCRTTVPPPKGG